MSQLKSATKFQTWNEMHLASHSICAKASVFLFTITHEERAERFHLLKTAAIAKLIKTLVSSPGTSCMARGRWHPRRWCFRCGHIPYQQLFCWNVKIQRRFSFASLDPTKGQDSNQEEIQEESWHPSSKTEIYQQR